MREFIITRHHFLAGLLVPCLFYFSGLTIFVFGQYNILPVNYYILLFLSLFLGTDQYYKDDFERGIIEKIALSHCFIWEFALAKLANYWLLQGLPILLLFAISLWLMNIGNSGQILLVATISSIIIMTILNFTAFIILGAKNGGFLAMVLAMPLLFPVVIFSAIAITSESPEQYWANIALLIGFGGLMMAISMGGFILFNRR